MIAPPQALIAEVTHRCPMHCVYCSNPLEMQSRTNELSTDKWVGIIQDAAALGCWHLHLTGGEPLSRHDLPSLVSAGRSAGLYVNLITSGLGLTYERLVHLVEAGLDHVQLSFQDSVETAADLFGGTRAHAHKLKTAAIIKQFPVAFTVNMVVHRSNLDRLDEFVALAEELKADKLEIANVQYYGWAVKNRTRLLPTREQLNRSLPVVAAAQERLRGKMRIDYVLPDYYARFPKPCMGGWGRTVLLVDPAGRAMPCHAAGTIPGLAFENASEKSLDWIWQESEAFQRFRGEDWMEEPCRSCDRKNIDFGGCRCQALLLAGSMRATDPACSKSPLRSTLEQIVAETNAAGTFDAPARGSWVYRIDPVSSSLEPKP
jgi:pyrroloquinoline quinone biosynthesis protein E